MAGDKPTTVRLEWIPLQEVQVTARTFHFVEDRDTGETPAVSPLPLAGEVGSRSGRGGKPHSRGDQPVRDVEIIRSITGTYPRSLTGGATFAIIALVVVGS